MFTDYLPQLAHWNEKIADNKTTTSSHSNQLSDDIFGKCIGKMIKLCLMISKTVYKILTFLSSEQKLKGSPYKSGRPCIWSLQLDIF